MKYLKLKSLLILLSIFFVHFYFGTINNFDKVLAISTNYPVATMSTYQLKTILQNDIDSANNLLKYYQTYPNHTSADVVGAIGKLQAQIESTKSEIKNIGNSTSKETKQKLVDADNSLRSAYNAANLINSYGFNPGASTDNYSDSTCSDIHDCETYFIKKGIIAGKKDSDGNYIKSAIGQFIPVTDPSGHMSTVNYFCGYADGQNPNNTYFYSDVGIRCVPNTITTTTTDTTRSGLVDRSSVNYNTLSHCELGHNVPVLGAECDKGCSDGKCLDENSCDIDSECPSSQVGDARCASGDPSLSLETTYSISKCVNHKCEVQKETRTERKICPGQLACNPSTNKCESPLDCSDNMKDSTGKPLGLTGDQFCNLKYVSSVLMGGDRLEAPNTRHCKAHQDYPLYNDNKIYAYSYGYKCISNRCTQYVNETPITANNTVEGKTGEIIVKDCGYNESTKIYDAMICSEKPAPAHCEKQLECDTDDQCYTARPNYSQPVITEETKGSNLICSKDGYKVTEAIRFYKCIDHKCNLLTKNGATVENCNKADGYYCAPAISSQDSKCKKDSGPVTMSCKTASDCGPGQHTYQCYHNDLGAAQFVNWIIGNSDWLAGEHYYTYSCTDSKCVKNDQVKKTRCLKGYICDSNKPELGCQKAASVLSPSNSSATTPTPSISQNNSPSTVGTTTQNQPSTPTPSVSVTPTPSTVVTPTPSTTTTTTTTTPSTSVVVPPSTSTGSNWVACYMSLGSMGHCTKPIDKDGKCNCSY